MALSDGTHLQLSIIESSFYYDTTYMTLRIVAGSIAGLILPTDQARRQPRIGAITEQASKVESKVGNDSENSKALDEKDTASACVDNAGSNRNRVESL
jgi:hypothetical protein